MNRRDPTELPKRRRVACALALAALALTIAAQDDPPRATFEEELEVTEVLLEVTVTDRHGRPVTGLGREDFVVEEDGAPVEILSFSLVESGRAAAGDALDVDPLGGASAGDVLDLALDEGPDERRFILFFDQPPELMGLFGRLVHAGHQAGWWLRDELRPGDRAAVVAYDRKLELHQDFTADLEALRRAAVRAAGRSLPERAPPERGAPSLFAHLPAAPRELLDRTTNRRKALTLLAAAAGEVPGRKHLVFFSLGEDVESRGPALFDRRFVPGLVETLNDHDVAVHSVYLGAPDVGPGRYSQVLDDLSRLTGGVYQAPRNFIHSMLVETSRALGAYYLLSYRTRYPSGTFGYREISVRTRDPDHDVHSRQGYFYGDL